MLAQVRLPSSMLAQVPLRLFTSSMLAQVVLRRTSSMLAQVTIFFMHLAQVPTPFTLVTTLRLPLIRRRTSSTRAQVGTRYRNPEPTVSIEIWNRRSAESMTTPLLRSTKKSTQLLPRTDITTTPLPLRTHIADQRQLSQAGAAWAQVPLAFTPARTTAPQPRKG